MWNEHQAHQEATSKSHSQRKLIIKERFVLKAREEDVEYPKYCGVEMCQHIKVLFDILSV